MKKISIFKAGFLGALFGGAAIAFSYLGNKILALPYIPFDIFEWATRVLPGRLVALTIDGMVSVIRKFNLGPTASTAKLAEQGIALVQFALIWIFFGVILGITVRRRAKAVQIVGLVGGGLLFGSALII